MNDATFIIFHAGNYEYIGIRHRKAQTLYLSRMIDVSELKPPAYVKLQVGLYIAAYRDAVPRARMLNNWCMQPSRDPSTMPLYTLEYDCDNIRYNDRPQNKRKPTEAEIKATDDVSFLCIASYSSFEFLSTRLFVLSLNVPSTKRSESPSQSPFFVNLLMGFSSYMRIPRPGNLSIRPSLTPPH